MLDTDDFRAPKYRSKTARGKASVSAVDVRRAIDAGLIDTIGGEFKRSKYGNLSELPDFSRSPLDLLIAIEQRNLATQARFSLDEIVGSMTVESVLGSIADTGNRPRELHLRKLQAEQSAERNRQAMESATDIDNTAKFRKEWKRDLSEWNSLDALPAEVIRREYKPEPALSNIEAEIVNDVIPAQTIYHPPSFADCVRWSITPPVLPDCDLTSEQSETTPVTRPESQQVKRERKQTVRRALIRKLKFIAHREQHHISSVKRIDGVLMVRYWIPVWTTPQRTKRKASRVRFNSPVCSHYVVHQVTLRNYLDVYDDSGIGTASQRIRWSKRSVSKAEPAKMELRQLVDVNRKPQRIAERIAGDSTSERIHNPPRWWQIQENE